MPDLGKATYVIEIDASQFERELAEAKAEAKLASEDINRSLSNVKIDPHIAAAKRIGDTHGNVLGDLTGGYATLHRQINDLKDTAASLDLTKGTNAMLDSAKKLHGSLTDTDATLAGIERRFKSISSTTDRIHKFRFDTSDAEVQLRKFDRNMNAFMKNAYTRMVQFDRDVATRFGLTGGGGKGGPYSRLMGSSTYAPARLGPSGFANTNRAVSSVAGVEALAQAMTPSGPSAAWSYGPTNSTSPYPSAWQLGLAPSGPSGPSPPRPVLRAGGDGGGRGRLAGLLYGRGFIPGTAAFGTLGSFAGFGGEHLLTVGGAVVGSGVSALAGGGLLAAGSAGKLAVGSGSDALVAKSTAADTKTLYQAYTNLDQAIANYGANSVAAHQATVALNQQMNNLGNTAGVRAELGVAKLANAVNDYWDKVTSPSRVQVAKLMTSGLELAKTYIPLVNQAATTNFGIINQGLKPLLGWLGGPQGMGIFQNLENQFAQQLPTAVHAFTQAIELVMKTVNYAAQYTGTWMQHVDAFFTKWNSPTGFLIWETHINKLIYDFHIWDNFIKILVKDIYGFFKNDASTGNSIIITLTDQLQKLHNWEQANGQKIHQLFELHKQEALALLHVGGSLLSIFGQLYMTVAPAMVTFANAVLKPIASIMADIAKHSQLAALALGGLLVSMKMGGIGATIAGARNILGLAALPGGKLAAGAAGAGAAGTEAATAGAGAAALTGTKLALLRGGLAAGGGMLAGGLIQGVTGLRSGAGGTIAGGIAGGILGAPFGALGIAIGSTIGSTLGPTIGHWLNQIFDTGPTYGERFAKGFVSSLDMMAPSINQGKWRKMISSSIDQYHAALQEVGTPNRGGLNRLPRKFRSGAGAAAVQSDRAKGAFNIGWSIGASLTAGLDQAVQHGAHVTPAIIRNDFLPAIRQALRLGGPQAGTQAAQMMLQYAQSLESNGTLPKGTVKKMIRDIENQLPALKSAFKTAGMDSAAALADALKFTDAQRNLKTVITDVGQQWAISNLSTKSGYKDMAANVTLEAGLLRDAMKSKNLAIRQDAQSSWAALVSSTETYSKDMARRALDQMANMNKKGSGQFWSMTSSAIAALKAIGDNTDQALRALGLSPPRWKWAMSVEGALGQQAQQQAFNQVNQFNKSYGYGPGHAAQGGYIGRPGQQSGDVVPTWLGLGEAVLNAQHQGVVNAALKRAYGINGLSDLFHRKAGSKHGYGGPGQMAYAGGGYAGYSLPLPRGSMMPGSWSVDQGVDIPAGAGTPEYAIGPGVILGEGISGFGPNAPILRITAGPLAGSTVYYGHAGPATVRVGQRVSAGQQVSEVGAGIVGISSGPHIEFGFYPPGGPHAGASMARVLNELLTGAKVAGTGSLGIGGGVWPGVTPGHVSGAGVLGQIANAALARVAGAVNKKYGAAGSISMPNAGHWQGALRQIAKQKGWSIDDWMWIVNKESGGNPLARNPSSGAFGLGQFLGATAQQYARFGALSTNPVAQIVAMAHYIADRYGSPTVAKAFHLSHNWYAGGRGGGGFRPNPPHKGMDKRLPSKRRAAVKNWQKLMAPFKGIADVTAFKTDYMTPYSDWDTELGNQYNMLTTIAGLNDAQGNPLTTLASDLIGTYMLNSRPGFLPSLNGISWPQFAPGESITDAEIANRNMDILVYQALGGADNSALGQLNPALSERADRMKAIQATLWSILEAAQSAKRRRDEIEQMRRNLTTGTLQQRLNYARSAFGSLDQMNAARQHLTSLLKARNQVQTTLAHQQSLGPAGNYSLIRNLQSQSGGLSNAIADANQHIQDLSYIRSRVAAGRSVNAAETAIYANRLSNEHAALGQQYSSLTAELSALGGWTLTRHPVPPTGGEYALASRDSDTLKADIYSASKDMSDIATSTVPQLRAVIAGLGGRATVTTTPTADQQVALLQQINQQLAQSLYVSQMQYPILQSFVGSFAVGTSYVPKTGMALIHEGEAIIPAEHNPFTHPTSTSAEVHIHGLGDFVDRVETVINGKKTEISDYVNHDMASHARARRLLPGPIT